MAELTMTNHQFFVCKNSLKSMFLYEILFKSIFLLIYSISIKSQPSCFLLFRKPLNEQGFVIEIHSTLKKNFYAAGV